MTYLSRGAILAAAIESSQGTYVAPTFTIPFTGSPSFETVYAPLRDESVRNNDSVLQGVYQGPGDSTWDMTIHAYPDILGYFLRHVGTDTVTAATTTTLSAQANPGASSISTAATIPAGSTIQIDVSPNAEYAVTGTPTGGGPYTIPLLNKVGGTALTLTGTHATSTAVTTTTKHTFKQNTPGTRPPAWSISTYDGVDYRGWPGCRMSELALKIDPKSTITAQAKFAGYPEQSVSSFSYSGSSVQPLLGWGWTMTNAGASSTRGLTLDLTLKRAADAIHASNGQQSPQEVFPGGLEIDGTYKARYENTTDMNLYLNNTQSPTVATLTKAITAGGESLVITMSQSGYTKGPRNLGGTYVDATFSLSGISNTTDSGITSIVLNNWVTTQF